MIPLKSRLTNGAAVSDWLGTAMTSARVAALYLEDIREGRSTDPAMFGQVLEYLESARLDVIAVQSHCANEALR